MNLNFIKLNYIKDKKSMKGKYYFLVFINFIKFNLKYLLIILLYNIKIYIFIIITYLYVLYIFIYEKINNIRISNPLYNL